MIINITVKEAWNRDIWDEVCEILGWNVYCYAEGTVSDNEIIKLTEEQARELRLI